MKLLGFEVGIDQPLFLIAGPCVVESKTLVEEVAGKVKDITTRLKIPFMFKASFKKANRSRLDSFTGIGDNEALGIIEEIGRAHV